MITIKNPKNLAIYKEFLDYYKPRVSSAGYDTIKYMGHAVIKWFEDKNIPLDSITVKDAMEYRKYLF